MRFAPFLLEDWLIKCRGAAIDLDHSGAPTPFGDGFDPCIGGEAWLDDLELEEKLFRLLAKQYRVKENRIVLTGGAQNANYLFLQSCVPPTDAVAIETPTYVPMRASADAMVTKVIEVKRTSKDHFSLSPEQVVKAINRGAKAVLLTNLHNPSARMLSDEELRAVLEEAARKGVPVLCDEIYREMSYARPSKPVCNLGENGVSTCGITKLWGLGGLRIGWLVGSEDIVEKVRMTRLYSTYHLPSRSMAVAYRAVREKQWFRDRVLRMAKHNLPVLDEWLKEEERVKVRRPDGGLMFLAMLPKGLNDEEFALRLFRKHKTAVCPGRYFGIGGAIRVTFSCGRSDFQQGLEHISSTLDAML